MKYYLSANAHLVPVEKDNPLLDMWNALYCVELFTPEKEEELKKVQSLGAYAALDIGETWEDSYTTRQERVSKWRKLMERALIVAGVPQATRDFVEEGFDASQFEHIRYHGNPSEELLAGLSEAEKAQLKDGEVGATFHAWWEGVEQGSLLRRYGGAGGVSDKDGVKAELVSQCARMSPSSLNKMLRETYAQWKTVERRPGQTVEAYHKEQKTNQERIVKFAQLAVWNELARAKEEKPYVQVEPEPCYEVQLFDSIPTQTVYLYDADLKPVPDATFAWFMNDMELGETRPILEHFDPQTSGTLSCRAYVGKDWVATYTVHIKVWASCVRSHRLFVLGTEKHGDVRWYPSYWSPRIQFIGRHSHLHNRPDGFSESQRASEPVSIAAELGELWDADNKTVYQALLEKWRGASTQPDVLLPPIEPKDSFEVWLAKKEQKKRQVEKEREADRQRWLQNLKEAERLEAERLEAERLEAERLEAEKKARLELLLGDLIAKFQKRKAEEERLREEKRLEDEQNMASFRTLVDTVQKTQTGLSEKITAWDALSTKTRTRNQPAEHLEELKTAFVATHKALETIEFLATDFEAIELAYQKVAQTPQWDAKLAELKVQAGKQDKKIRGLRDDFKTKIPPAELPELESS